MLIVDLRTEPGDQSALLRQRLEGFTFTAAHARDTATRTRAAGPTHARDHREAPGGGRLQLPGRRLEGRPRRLRGDREPDRQASPRHPHDYRTAGACCSCRKCNHRRSRTSSKMPALLQNNWRELALKWALRYAVDNNLAAVAWTTGWIQTDRYAWHRDHPRPRRLGEHPGLQPTRTRTASEGCRPAIERAAVNPHMIRLDAIRLSLSEDMHIFDATRVGRWRPVDWRQHQLRW